MGGHVSSGATTLPSTAAQSPRNVAMQLLSSRAFHNSSPTLTEDWKSDQGELKSAPGWKEENATDSEADVKADREPLPKNVKELQSESIQNLRSKETLFDKVQDEAQHLQFEAKQMEQSVLDGARSTASAVKEAVADSADFVAKAFVGGTDHSRIKKKHEAHHH
ncbi:hypothetical protein DFQ26_006711 [Actinomortierella ambigua]|nr:hypothetical protein DFQ26_006711 [Actinomortierella ambigua]